MKGNENALCVCRGHAHRLFESIHRGNALNGARVRERERKKRSKAQTRKNHPVGLVTRARKTRGAGVERRSSKYQRGKNGNNGLAIARDHARDVG